MRVSVCVLLATVLLTAPAAGFGFGPGPGDEGPDVMRDMEFKPVVGHWAEYRMTPKGEKPMTMKFAIVGKEDDAFWFETTMTGQEGETMISKVLVAGDPRDMKSAKRMIVKPGDQPAMEMPVDMMAMGEMGEPEKKEEKTEPMMDDLGVEPITVPAGTFEASHWQFASEGETYDAWVKSGIGPYGLIKSSSPEHEMVLIGHGDDAKSAITEEPQKMPAMGFPMGGMGGE